MKKTILILVLSILIISCTGQIGETKPAVEKGNQSATVQEDAVTPEDSTSEDEISEPVAVAPAQKNDKPIDVLSDSLVQKWGADCRSKASDMEKANCILDWQGKNIVWCYTHPEETVMPKMFEADYPECVVDMQLQQMKPGSFPLSKVMDLKIKNNKLFGACYTYAVTYCAVARWNGLTCRVMEADIIVPMLFSTSSGDYGPDYCGAVPKSYLDALGYDCEEWRRLDWRVGQDHYWAEVLIDGEWKLMERYAWAYKRDTQKYIIDAGRTYRDTGW